VSWLPALGGWPVTRRDLALRVMRDAASFTVDDPRFTTGRVVGQSMLSLDGAEHARHRDPFTRSFGHAEVRARLAAFMHQAALDKGIDPTGSRSPAPCASSAARSPPRRRFPPHDWPGH